MATAGAFWKGHLRLALVTIPIRLVSATTSEDKIALHQVDRKSKQRIRYQKVAGETGKVVPRKRISCRAMNSRTEVTCSSSRTSSTNSS
jgi:DNA end-binding protein Ku